MIASLSLNAYLYEDMYGGLQNEYKNPSTTANVEDLLNVSTGEENTIPVVDQISSINADTTNDIFKSDFEQSCGCPTTCDESALRTFIKDFRCYRRIAYLQEHYGHNRLDACEYAVSGGYCPETCSPSKCQANSDNNRTNNETTNSEVLNENVVSDTINVQENLDTKSEANTNEGISSSYESDGNFEQSCGCPTTCDESALRTFIKDFRCYRRIAYLQEHYGHNRLDACEYAVSGGYCPETCSPSKC